jgi:hypothetical protein
MKLHGLIFTSLSAGLLAGVGHAQQAFGNWVHDTNSTILSLFAAPNGLATNSGFSPSSPLPIDLAIQQADFWLSIFGPSTGKGITVNLLPGTYALNQPLSIPAFGLSLEAYYDASGTSSVLIAPAVPFSNQGTIEVNQVTGPLTEKVNDTTQTLPPTILRGLNISASPGAYGVLIDPSQNGLPANWTNPCQVGINQCRLFGVGGDGIRVRTSTAGAPIHLNQIVDNQFSGLRWGIGIENSAQGSDLIRSNRMFTTFTGIFVQSPTAGAGSLHPRILSNAIAGVTGDFGIYLQGSSGRIVNNTVAFVRNFTGSTVPASIRVENGGAAQQVVIANNILFSPQYALPNGNPFNPAEVQLPTGAPAGLVLESNDFDASGLLTSIVLPISISNTPIANPQFVQAFAPFDLHLTAASPSVANLGNGAFVFPGASVVAAGQPVAANHALDMDLDPRSTMRAVTFDEVIHRGADQFSPEGVRLRYAASGGLSQADAFGNLRVNALGQANLDAELALPTGSFWLMFLGATLPMGAELQHVLVPGFNFGSLAIDPLAPNGTQIAGASSVTTTPVTTIPLAFGTLMPSFNEAEFYLQAMVFLPNGVTTFSNRLRVDIDGL